MRPGRTAHCQFDLLTSPRIHEDIKPQNILIFRGSSRSPYSFTAKIADFGLFSHVKESKASSREAMGLDNHGNQRFSESPDQQLWPRQTAAD